MNLFESVMEGVFETIVNTMSNMIEILKHVFTINAKIISKCLNLEI